MALDYIAIGKRLKKARQNMHLTQEKFAEIIDISPPCLSRIECGNYKINLTRLDDMCNKLDVPLGTILDGVSTSSSDYLNNDFSSLLKSCPPEKIKLIYKVAKTIAEE